MNKFNLWWKIIAGIILIGGLIVGGIQVHTLYLKDGLFPAVLTALVILTPAAFVTHAVYFK